MSDTLHGDIPGVDIMFWFLCSSATSVTGFWIIWKSSLISVKERGVKTQGSLTILQLCYCKKKYSAERAGLDWVTQLANLIFSLCHISCVNISLWMIRLCWCCMFTQALNGSFTSPQTLFTPWNLSFEHLQQLQHNKCESSNRCFPFLIFSCSSFYICFLKTTLE